MRYIFFILLLISCDKEDLKKCEIDQTFTLKFYNDYGRAKTLNVGSDIIDVSKTSHLDVTVNIFEEVSVTYPTNTSDTTEYIKQRPNPCAIYYLVY